MPVPHARDIWVSIQITSLDSAEPSFHQRNAMYPSFTFPFKRKQSIKSYWVIPSLQTTLTTLCIGKWHESRKVSRYRGQLAGTCPGGLQSRGATYGLPPGNGPRRVPVPGHALGTTAEKDKSASGSILAAGWCR